MLAQILYRLIRECLSVIERCIQISFKLWALQYILPEVARTSPRSVEILTFD